MTLTLLCQTDYTPQPVQPIIVQVQMQPVGPRVIVPPEAGQLPLLWWSCYGGFSPAWQSQRRMSYHILDAQSQFFGW